MAERPPQEMWAERKRRLEALLSRADLNREQHDILDPQLYSAAKGPDVDKFIKALEDHCARERVPLPIVLGRRSPLGNTLLHAAAESSNNVRAIIDFFPEHMISCKNSKGETPLHIAARAGQIDAVELLLPRGNPTCTDHSGNSALHEAVRNGHIPVIRRLVRGDPNPLYRQNKESKSPWCVAVETGNKDVLADLLAVTNDGKDQRRLETRDVFGMSPVHIAITHKNMDMLKEMREKKPGLFRLRDSGGGTPLHLAAYTNYLDGVKFLIQHYGTNAVEQDSTDGYLPIHVACMMDHTEIVTELLEQQSDPAEFLTRLGQNILHVSAQHGRAATVKYILNNPKFDHLINARDFEGNTPLHVAVLRCHPSVLLLARDRRIDLSLVNYNNMTASDVVEQDIIAYDDLLSKRLMRIVLISAGAQRSWELAICDPNGRIPLKRSKLPGLGVLKEHVGTLLVMATLTASVAFVLGFSAPRGYYASDAYAALLHKAMDDVFVISNSTAMYSAIAIMAITLLLLTIVLISAGAQRSWELAICDPNGRIPLKRSKLPGLGVLKEHVGTLLVMATLTASVAFILGFSAPGGYYASDAYAALLHKAMDDVFVISNSTAMYSAIMAITLLLLTIVNDPNVKGVAIFLSMILLCVALTAIPLAFMAGVYGNVTKPYWLSIFVLVHGSLALFIFLSFLFFFSFPRWCRNPLLHFFSDRIIYWALLIAKRYRL